jgi:hypothetical protein
MRRASSSPPRCRPPSRPGPRRAFGTSRPIQALRERHQTQAKILKLRLKGLGLPIIDHGSHIVPVIVGDPVHTKMLSDMLLENFGIYVQPINYPTVPRGTERLRFTPSPVHGPEETDRLVRAMEDEEHPEPAKQRGFDDYELRLGDIMRGERATMGKSLLDVQRELRIKATYISAIENADPSAFETPGFVAGYVRSYARYLGLEPDWAFRTFCEEGRFDLGTSMGTGAKGARPADARGSGLRDPFTEPTVSFIPKGEARLSRLEPAAIGSLAVLLALTGALGYGGWSVLREVQRVQLTPVDQVPGVLAEISPLAEPSAVFAPAETAAVAPSPEIFDRLYRPQTLDAPVLVPRDGPIATLDPASVGVLADDPRERMLALSRGGAPELAGQEVNRAIAQALMGVDQGAETDAAPGVQVTAQPPEVALFAVQPSWVRVQQADGTIILEKILEAGERFVLPHVAQPHPPLAQHLPPQVAADHGGLGAGGGRRADHRADHDQHADTPT